MAKKIVITSNGSFIFSGFGKNLRILLSYLYTRKNPDGSKKWECIEISQGVREGDARLKATPWKCYGGIPENESLITEGQPRDANGNFDPNLQRMVSYGAAVIEDILKKEKPHIFWAVEDIWGMFALRKYSNRPYIPYYETEWWDKFNTIIQTPIDSLPLLPEVIDAAAKSKNFFVKSSFAMDELHRLGHKHVDLWPCLMDANKFKVYSPEEKVDLKKKYGIDGDCILFAFLSRNQNRKKFVECIDAFKLFKDKNPEAKAKFLFITNFSEGWPLKRAIKNAGLLPSDVICSHICHSCGLPTLKEIEEEVGDCLRCNTKGSLRNITVEKGISEEDLGEILGMVDGYTGVIDSGGFENSLAEAAMAGIPTCTVNYAFGEFFMQSGAVFPLEFVFSTEISSLFKKANVKISSICDFMEEVYKNPEESRQKGLRFRDWAMKTIHPDIVLEKIEKFLDQLPESSYDFDFVTEFPQADAPFPNTESPDDFLKHLYKSFFGQDLKETDKNFLDMKEHLNRGATREQIYNQCKSIAQNELAKREKPDLKSFFKNTPPHKRILLWEMPGDYGDSLLSLAPLEALHKLYPSDEWDIYVSCLPQYVQIYEHLDFIAGFVPFFGIEHFEIWEGSRNSDKIVDIWIAPNRDGNYKHNGLKKSEFHLDKSLGLE